MDKQFSKPQMWTLWDLFVWKALPSVENFGPIHVVDINPNIIISLNSNKDLWQLVVL